jgi:hypothetical protein
MHRLRKPFSPVSAAKTLRNGRIDAVVSTSAFGGVRWNGDGGFVNGVNVSGRRFTQRFTEKTAVLRRGVYEV